MRHCGRHSGQLDGYLVQTREDLVHAVAEATHHPRAGQTLQGVASLLQTEDVDVEIDRAVPGHGGQLPSGVRGVDVQVKSDLTIRGELLQLCAVLGQTGLFDGQLRADLDAPVAGEGLQCFLGLCDTVHLRLDLRRDGLTGLVLPRHQVGHGLRQIRFEFDLLGVVLDTSKLRLELRDVGLRLSDLQAHGDVRLALHLGQRFPHLLDLRSRLNDLGPNVDLRLNLQVLDAPLDVSNVVGGLVDAGVEFDAVLLAGHRFDASDFLREVLDLVRLDLDLEFDVFPVELVHRLLERGDALLGLCDLLGVRLDLEFERRRPFEDLAPGFRLGGVQQGLEHRLAPLLLPTGDGRIELLRVRRDADVDLADVRHVSPPPVAGFPSAARIAEVSPPRTTIRSVGGLRVWLAAERPPFFMINTFRI